MDLQSQKLELIKWLTEVEDPKILSRFMSLKNKAASTEDEAIDASLERGLKDIKKGDTKSHLDVKAKYDQWL